MLNCICFEEDPAIQPLTISSAILPNHAPNLRQSESCFIEAEAVTSISRRLEIYTLKRPQEVLLVHAEIEGELDEIAIFKGFSSSLMRPTAYDPEVPVLPENATITAIDRLYGPFNPQNPRYIEQGRSLADMEELLAEIGL